MSTHPNTSSLHPALWLAAASVTAVSLAGVAKLTGVLPDFGSTPPAVTETVVTPPAALEAPSARIAAAPAAPAAAPAVAEPTPPAKVERPAAKPGPAREHAKLRAAPRLRLTPCLHHRRPARVMLPTHRRHAATAV